MKKTAWILGIGAVIASVVLVMLRQEESTAPPGSATVAGEREPANGRSRSVRDSGEERDEDFETGSPQPLPNPSQALADAVAGLKEPELAIELAELLGRWSQTDPEAALAWVEASGRSDAEDLRAHVIFIWADKSPVAAATWLEENPGMQQPANLLALLGTWMESSPEAAVAWSTTKIEVIQREGILADLLVSCGSEANALALLGEVDPIVADGALQAAVTSLADEEPEFAEKLSTLITGTGESTGDKPLIENTSSSGESATPRIRPENGDGTLTPGAD